jgi:ubiquitin-protein ligase
MSDIRQRRIENDFNRLREWADERPGIAIEREGDEIRVHLEERGLGWSDKEGVSVLGIHSFAIYLHREYPRLPPKVTCLGETFHPNLLPADQGGAVCLGPWRPSSSLAGVVQYLLDLVSFRAYNVADPLNERCAFWLRSHDPLEVMEG